MTPAFLKPWAASFAGPLRVGRWNDQGLVFFHQGSQGWELLGGQDVADRLDGLCPDPEFWSSLRRECAGWGKVSFPNLSGDGWALQQRQPQDQVEVTDQSPFVTLRSDFETYLSNLDGKSRHELRRKMRRAERLCQEGLEIRREGHHLEVFLQLMASSQPAKAAFLGALQMEFFRQLAGSLEAAGMLRLTTLWDGTQVLAGMFQIDFAGVRHLYNSGFEPLQSALAPGLVCLGHCLQDACQEGLAEFDFLRGTERYKYDLGGRDRAVYRMLWDYP
jgi:hypothetical protein